MAGVRREPGSYRVPAVPPAPYLRPPAWREAGAACAGSRRRGPAPRWRVPVIRNSDGQPEAGPVSAPRLLRLRPAIQSPTGVTLTGCGSASGHPRLRGIPAVCPRPGGRPHSGPRIRALCRTLARSARCAGRLALRWPQCADAGLAGVTAARGSRAADSAVTEGGKGRAGPRQVAQTSEFQRGLTRAGGGELSVLGPSA